MGIGDFSTGSLLDAPQEEIKLPPDPLNERRKALAGTPDERAQYTFDIPIACNGYRKANLYIDALMARAKVTDRPGGVWIIGNGGSGKTFIIERLLKRFAPREGRFCRECPVLYLHFSARPSQGEIYTRLLLQLGQDPRGLRRMSIEDLKSTLKRSVKTAGTLLCAFDESQHLWVMSQKRRDEDAGGTIGAAIKLLYEELGVAFVFLGTTPLDEVRKSDSQTTRWPGVVRLAPFSYDDEFLSLLATLDECLPMPHQAGLVKKDLSRKIVDSCIGNFRLLKMLLQEAVREAARIGDQSITLKHLAQAHFLVHCSEDTPFGAI